MNFVEQLDELEQRVNAWEYNLKTVEDDVCDSRDDVRDEITSVKEAIQLLWDAVNRLGAQLPLIPPR